MTREQIWQAVLGELELIISRANFTTWFKHTFVVAAENGRIIVGVPNTFTKTWLEKKYHPEIMKAVQNVTSEPVAEIVYTVQVRRPATEMMTAASPTSRHVSEIRPESSDDGLNGKYRFETFIVGKGNELAHAAAQAVTTAPGQSYNPLFIYGGVGLGKTHLLQAIGLKLFEQRHRVVYVTSERFTSDYIQAVRAGRAKEFRGRYRTADILLIDDIQFIAGKEGTQEEFFHTFNTLHQNNRQIVLTSDRPPKSIPALEQRLLSRFEWGMIANISQPDIETRMAILEAKCKERQVVIERDVTQFLAATFHQNIRELEGALTRLVAECQFYNQAPSLAVAEKLFCESPTTNTSSRRTLSPKRLIETVCRYYDVALPDLVGKSRKRELVIPRQITMYLLREEGQVSFPSIGQQLGQRDHTTAMYACERIRIALENNETIRHDITTLRQQLYSNL